MKALLLSAIVFFSLRAMAAEVGEDQKSQCIFANQNASRQAKVVEEVVVQKPAEVKTSISQ